MTDELENLRAEIKYYCEDAYLLAGVDRVISLLTEEKEGE